MTSAERYAKSVFHYLYENGPMTRTHLMKALKMRQNSIVDICNVLEESKSLLKTERNRRRNIPIFLNPEKFAVIGVEHAVPYLEFTLIDGHRKQIAARSMPMDPALTGEERLHFIFDAVRAFRAECPRKYRIAGLGFADVGMIDSGRGVSVFSAHVRGWENRPLAELFQKEFGLYTKIVDRSGASAFSYCIRNPEERAIRDSIQIWISNGIGASILHNGRFWGTGVPSACQIGHTILNPGGSPCLCGNRGCLETISSVPSILARAAALAGKTYADARSLVRAAEAGDAAARTALSEGAEALGIALGNTVTFSSVVNIYLRSVLFEDNGFFLDMVSRAITKNTLPVLRKQLRIFASTQGQDCAADGAALFAQKEYFSTANPEAIPLK